ncbi:MAG TPA: hypothetical protein VNT56_10985 [Acidimicrobiales bacterium]|nr:hypothetical protein [Acidimicrobiales bacterium]
MDGDDDQGSAPAPEPGEDAPDWTTWLRSRLERVSNSERRATGEAPPALLVEMEALRAAVASLVAGIGALTDSFSTFRSGLNERLDEHTRRVREAARQSASGTDQARQALTGATADLGRALAAVEGRLDGVAGQLQELAAAGEASPAPSAAGSGTDELRSILADQGERLDRLVLGMDELVAVRSDDDRWAEVMGRLLDEIDAERVAEAEAPGRPEPAGGLDEIEDSLVRIEADLSQLASRPPPAPLHLDDDQVRRLARALAEMIPAAVPGPAPAAPPADPPPAPVRARPVAARRRGRRDAPLRAPRPAGGERSP